MSNEKKIIRKLRAILSADVKGYSILIAHDEVFTIRLLKEYRSIMATCIEQYNGRVVDNPGDNILAEFASAGDAVQCAVDIQIKLKKENDRLVEEKKLKFRIGINIGEVVKDGDRIYGDGINIAARIEGLADAGGICISGRVYDQIENKFDFIYEFLGEKEVKNVSRPIKVYRVLSYPEVIAHRPIKTKKVVGKLWRNIFIGAICIFVGCAITTAIWYFYLTPPHTLTESATERRPELILPELPSIAVLPFVNVGGEAEQEYFSDGITDDLITDLSKISGLFVIARNSVFTYKDKPLIIQQVARELGVRYVLEGSVRRSGEKLRINAQLIEATNGHHLWAERYDGQVGDVFALQDLITEKIVSALAVQLTSGEQKLIEYKHTNNLAAYDAFLQGRAHYFRCTPEEYVKAVSFFKKAVELDPNYGQAYAALAMTFWESSLNLWTFHLGVAWWEARNIAEDYLKKAMRTPSSLSHQAASKILIDQQKHTDAINEAQRAIALDPNDANSYLAMAYALIYAGEPKTAIDFVEKAVRLDPHYPAYYLFVLGLAHFVVDQYEDALILFERALKRNPENYVPLIPLAAAHAHLGHIKEAEATIEKLQKSLPIFVTLSTLKKLPLWSYKKTVDQARLINGLRKAGMSETPYDMMRKPD